MRGKKEARRKNRLIAKRLKHGGTNFGVPNDYVTKQIIPEQTQPAFGASASVFSRFIGNVRKTFRKVMKKK